MHSFEAQRAKIGEQPAPRLTHGIFSPDFGVAIVEKDDIRMEERRQPVGVFRFKASEKVFDNIVVAGAHVEIPFTW
jgi:hypothetical protein